MHATKTSATETAPWNCCGVRQGDPLGPLLFALMYQPTLSDAQESEADTLVMACHDDTYIQGGEEAVIAGAAHIMSRHACQRQKTLVFCAETDKVHHVPTKLGATVAPDGLVAWRGVAWHGTGARQLH